MTEGGIIVLPVGGRYEQELTRVTRIGSRTETEALGGCRFVPLVGMYGFQS